MGGICVFGVDKGRCRVLDRLPFVFILGTTLICYKDILWYMPRAKGQGLQELRSCQDVVSSVFGMGSLEMKIYRMLVKDGGMRADTVGQRIDKDRSTAYRALEKLVASGLCVKEKHHLEEGGYYHMYDPMPLGEVKERARKCIEMWYKGAISRLDELDELLG